MWQFALGLQWGLETVGCEVVGQGCPAGKGNSDLAEIRLLLWLVRVSWPCDGALLWEWGR